MNDWLFLSPIDVWMFRGALPFTAGESYVANSIFPPFPETIQGVLRTARLEAEEIDWQEYAMGRINPELADLVGLPPLFHLDGTLQRPLRPGKYMLRGPWIARYNGDTLERYFPIPLDILRSIDDQPSASVQYLLAKPEKPAFATTPPKGWKSERSPWHALVSPQTSGRISSLEHCWLDEDQFRRYLLGIPPTEVIEKEKLYAIEERPGVGLDHSTRTAREGFFYAARFIRPCEHIGLVEEIEGQLFPAEQFPNGTIGLGGEGRMARFTRIKAPDPLPQTANGDLKIILLTPAWFSGGWQPSDGQWIPWVGPNAKLVSVALGKPQTIGGWDIANRRPKPLLTYVPTGSVFYFRDAEMGDTPFTEFPSDRPDLAACGYGVYATAPWK